MSEQRRRRNWSRALRQSPHELDPLTWLAGNHVSLVFGALVVVACTPSILWSDGSIVEVLAQLGALLLMAASCVVVFWFSRPARGRLTLPRAAIPVIMAGLAMTLSAVNVGSPSGVGSLMPIEAWWAPLGAGLVLGALAPYTSVVRMLVMSAALILLASVCAVAGFTNDLWPVVSTVAIAIVPLVIAAGAAVSFQYQVAKRIQRWVAREVPAVVTGELLGEQARLTAVEKELAVVSARVQPLLTAIAERGHVTEDDQAAATVLANEIRGELVERSNRSWLDHVATGRPITVVDPDHRADTMDELQRSTVHGLLLAVLDSPEVEFPQLLIELRGETDGSTAVAITIDAGLAEGRRIMLLAPHYLSLRTAADDVTWKGGDTIRMRFRATQGAD